MQRVPEDENLARIGGLPLDEAEEIALSLAERDRLAVVAWAYEKLRENWRQLGTYRSLLALLGFEGTTVADPYRVLMAAGALDLNNALPEEPRSDPSES
jgi:hypothetical protein